MMEHITVEAMLFFILGAAVYYAIRFVHEWVNRRRYKRDIEKMKEDYYCPDHGEPWIWVNDRGERICAYWIEVAVEEARWGCPQAEKEE